MMLNAKASWKGDEAMSAPAGGCLFLARSCVGAWAAVSATRIAPMQLIAAKRMAASSSTDVAIRDTR